MLQEEEVETSLRVNLPLLLFLTLEAEGSLDAHWFLVPALRC